MFVDMTWPQKHWLVMGMIARIVLSSASVKTGYRAARVNLVLRSTYKKQSLLSELLLHELRVFART
jgi:hypothetical protein